LMPTFPPMFLFIWVTYLKQILPTWTNEEEQEIENAEQSLLM